MVSYEAASGQKMNEQKTSVFFSTNTPQQLRNSLVGGIGSRSSVDFEKYLGLPSVVGRSKYKSF